MHIELRKEKMEELRMLYKDTTEEIRNFKRQQWIITNYGLIVIGGIIAFVKLLTDNSASNLDPNAKVFIMVMALTIAGVESWLHVKIQKHFEYLRRREKRIREKFSIAFESALLDEREPKSYISFWNWWEYPFFMILAVWMGVSLVWWYLYPCSFSGFLKWVVRVFGFGD